MTRSGRINRKSRINKKSSMTKRRKVISIICIVFLVLITSALITTCKTVQKLMPIKVSEWYAGKYKQVRDYGILSRKLKGRSDITVLGTVRYDEAEYPLYDIYINNNADSDVFIFGGVHGNEPAGVQAALQLADLLYNFHGFNFHIIPVVNPWGWQFNCRYNGMGVDINRDFGNYRNISQEAEIIMSSFRKYKAAVVFDLHESYSQNYYVYVYDNEMENAAREFLQQNKYEAENRHKAGGLSVKEGILHPPGILITLLRLSDRAALANYFLGKTDLVTTTESSTKHNLKNRISFHTDAVLFILNKIKTR